MSERPLFERPIDDVLPPTHRSAPAPSGSALSPAPGVARERPDTELLAIARYQKWLIRIILLQILLVCAGVGLGLAGAGDGAGETSTAFLVAATAAVLLGVVSLVVVFLLASKLYGTATAVVLGLCLLVLCGGTITLLVVNARATAELRRNGIRVGFLGARRADLVALAPGPRQPGDARMPKLGW
ncbi:hypothetical protein J8F10_13115 [Gemmata sp. G18]|uniref:Uncharacterized protein n=1 Tax=Gemmata palustris TaxID=2822762 RepID=A0ABS5BRA8_9BACT|nr:hypothetical protein [Gemmata palustris]MBP3956224.1 hypothetical protein [Gemmata palustris]